MKFSIRVISNNYYKNQQITLNLPMSSLKKTNQKTHLLEIPVMGCIKQQQQSVSYVMKKHNIYKNWADATLIKWRKKN